MAIQVNCSCGRTCNFPDPMAGQTARCVYCGQPLSVPLIGGAPAAPVLHEPVRFSAPEAPCSGEEFKLEMSKPSQHIPTAGAPPRPVPGLGAKPFEPVRHPAPGIHVGRIVFWGVTASVLGLIVFGIYSLVHWWNMSEYESLIHGGHDWLAKGYLTDAEFHFNKAKALFPNDRRTAEAFQKLAQAKEDKKRNPQPVNAILGPLGAPGMVSPDAQQRMLQAQQMLLQTQTLQQKKQREIERRVREEQDPPAMPVAVPKPPQEVLLNPSTTTTAPTKDLQALRAEEAAKRAEAMRLATEERQKRLEEARKAAEELKLKAAEARKAQEEETRKRALLVALGQLSAWSENILREVTPAVALPAPWTEARDIDSVAAAIKKTIDDGANDTVVIPPPPLLLKIADIEDGPGLAEYGRSLPRQIALIEEIETARRSAKIVYRNQIATALRTFDRLLQQENLLKTQPTPDAIQKREALLAEKTRTGDRLKEQAAVFLKNLNEYRAARAARELLQDARKRTAARLAALGLDAQPANANAPSAPATTTAAPVKPKIYVLKDGTEIKAVTVGSMGDRLLIKDDAGELHTVEQSEVKEIRK